MSHRHTFTHLILVISMLLSMALALVPLDSASAQGKDGLRRQFNAQKGKVSFIAPESGPVLPAAQALGISASIRPADPAIALAKRFGPEFGLKDPERDLTRIQTENPGDGRVKVTYQQSHQGIPVMGGELIVNTNENGDLYSINGEVSSNLSLLPSGQLTIDSEQAIQTALEAVAKWYQKTSADFIVSEPELWIFDESLLRTSTRPVELVWRMEVTSVDKSMPVRELVLVNAHRGNLSLHFNQVDTVWAASGNSQTNKALETTAMIEGSPAQALTAVVKTYTAANGTVLPGTLLCTQTAPGCTNGSNPHADKAHLYAIGTYNLYQSNHNRNSIDNNNMPVISTVNYDSGYANAFWSGEQMVYGDGYGFALADDVVAHELTHGVTQYESNLFYYYQSGAINESFSDLWGEYYDQTNGKGADAAGLKWQIGEDISGLGTIRSMNNPPAFSNPDKMSSAYYSEGEEDNGGVHGNSGLNNKAVFLLVDGGTFNGKTVSAIGWVKTAAIYYEVNANLLSSGADYSDLYFALQRACSNLIGQKGITTGDCAEVKDAVDAVEMNGQPAQNFNTDAPLCSTGTPNIAFVDDLENGSARWSFSNGGTTRWQIDSPYYGLYAQSGLHSLYADDYPAAITDANARLAPFTVPNNAYLHFAHAFGFESFGDPYYFDGGVLEYSSNGGSTWLDAGSLIDFNGYKGTIYNDWNNPLRGRPAFVGSSHGYISTRLNLASLAGKTVIFRWRMGLDDVISAWGWWVDNVQVYTCAGTPNTSPPVSPGTYDDTHAAWQYSSGWTAAGASGPHANTMHYTNTPNATATIAFSGTKFTLTYTKHPNRGNFEVWVDGGLVTTVNASSASLQWQQTYTSPSFTDGIHTLMIKNVNSDGKYTDVDAIQIFGVPMSVPAGIFDDTDSNWMYSGAWTGFSGSGPYANSMHYSATVGSSAELLFTGTRFTLTYTKHPNRGNIEVWVDGALVTTVNANSAALAWQQVYTSPVLSAGNHTVRLVHAGPSGTYIDIDALQVFGTPVAAGSYDDAHAAWQYLPGWTVYTGAGPANNTLRYTNTVGNYTSVLFTGTQFTLTFTKHPNRGLIDVYVDGVKITTLNANNPTMAWQQAYTNPTLPAGNHTVRFVHAGPSGTYVDVDAITILP